jgi:hypothetical protein
LIGQAAQKMIKRLQQLPHENEDKNQNIDDDDLAQVLSAKITSFLLPTIHGY